jgi:hypothetical protein
MPGSETLNKMTDSQIPLGLKSALESAIKIQNGSLVIGQSAQGNSSESTINNSPKTSSQVPQTSAQRQSPNSSFGSNDCQVKVYTTSIRMPESPPR